MKFDKSTLAAALLVAIVSCVINVEGESKLKDIYNIVVLGDTGVGKSSLLNMFAGTDAFEVGNRDESETPIISAKVFRMIGREFNSIQLRLIDTQSVLDDTAGDPGEHIKKMIYNLKSLEHIDLFLICLDSRNLRFSAYLQSTISLFSQIFPDFLSHSALVFNKWTFTNAQHAVHLSEQYKAKFKNDYGLDSIRCFFIDSLYIRNGNFGQERTHNNRIELFRPHFQVIDLVNYLTGKANACDMRIFG